MFVILWQFEVKPGNQGRFEMAYGPQGPWAQLFRSDPAYRGTQLVRDASHDCRYFTLDFWNSETAYRSFLAAHRHTYDELDLSLQAVTHNEQHILSVELDSALLRL